MKMPIKSIETHQLTSASKPFLFILFSMLTATGIHTIQITPKISIREIVISWFWIGEGNHSALFLRRHYVNSTWSAGIRVQAKPSRLEKLMARVQQVGPSSFARS
ncbi:hypothetical protein [Tateyamaria sp.]|uniref:hypothetical protein n=1 Tax=Tateyamaria sp. TaxID=1929288 RepID=UPI00329FA8D7